MTDPTSLLVTEFELSLGPRANFLRIPEWRKEDFVLNSTHKELIKSWLIALGVPERRVATMGDAGLHNAYGAGRSFAERLKSEEIERRFGKPKRRGGAGLEIDLDAPAGLPIDLLSQTPPGPINERPEHQSPRTQPEQDLTAVVRRAVEAIVPPRLNAIAASLMATTNDSIKDAIQGLAIPTKVANAIHDQTAALVERVVGEAQTAVAEAIATSLPKRIELRTPSGQIRLLETEPRHKVFEPCLKRLAIGRHVYLVGGAGTGKTHLFKQLAKALDRPVTILGQALTKYEFSGHIGPTGEYVKTLLRTAVEEGHLLAIDEIDMSAAAAIGFLNSLTANRYVAFPDRMIDAHPNFVVIAAANTTGHGATMQYVGRNPLDAASLDRFVYIECDYDEDLERQIYGNGPWVRYCHKVRAACRELRQNHIISMRAIERCLDGEALGDSPDEIAQQGLWRNLAPDVISKIKNEAGEPPRVHLVEVA